MSSTATKCSCQGDVLKIIAHCQADFNKNSKKIYGIMNETVRTNFDTGLNSANAVRDGAEKNSEAMAHQATVAAIFGAVGVTLALTGGVLGGAAANAGTEGALSAADAANAGEEAATTGVTAELTPADQEASTTTAATSTTADPTAAPADPEASTVATSTDTTAADDTAAAAAKPSKSALEKAAIALKGKAGRSLAVVGALEATAGAMGSVSKAVEISVTNKDTKEAKMNEAKSQMFQTTSEVYRQMVTTTQSIGDGSIKARDAAGDVMGQVMQTLLASSRA